jgi:prolyl 3-hydroxylase /prolyl 3,4-dihydroxylase
MELKQIISLPLLQQWLNHENLRSKNIENYRKKYQNNKPFHHIKIFELLKTERVKKIEKAIEEIKFNLIESDLFKFLQSDRIDKTDNITLNEFSSFLSSTEFKAYLSYITRLEFKPQIDLSASVYEDTHYLLPHDDQLKGRKLAFMFYLSTLDSKNGGKLILYKTKNKKPLEAEKAIIPTLNSFVCFTVSQKSFHEVEEVLGQTQRVTLGGWFHG